jgi:hypothetical protein
MMLYDCCSTCIHDVQNVGSVVRRAEKMEDGGMKCD